MRNNSVNKHVIKSIFLALCIHTHVVCAEDHNADESASHNPKIQISKIYHQNAFVGERVYVGVHARSIYGAKDPQRFAFRGAPTSCGNLIKLTVTKVGGGQECDYYSYYCEDDDNDVMFISMISGSFSAWFTPWTTGQYKYKYILSNDKEMHFPFFLPEPGKPHKKGSFNANVWIGRVVHEGTITVHPITPSGMPTNEEYTKLEKRAEKDPCYRRVFIPMQVARNLKRDIVSEYVPFYTRYQALRELSDLRHMYATQTLVDILDELPTLSLLHLMTVKSLYEITLCGSGYLALPTIRDIALNRESAVIERELCVHLLKQFELQPNITNKGKVIHVISEEEKTLATDAIKKLMSDLDNEPEEIQHLLRPLW